MENPISFLETPLHEHLLEIPGDVLLTSLLETPPRTPPRTQELFPNNTIEFVTPISSITKSVITTISDSFSPGMMSPSIYFPNSVTNMETPDIVAQNQLYNLLSSPQGLDNPQTPIQEVINPQTPIQEVINPQTPIQEVINPQAPIQEVINPQPPIQEEILNDILVIKRPRLK